VQSSNALPFLRAPDLNIADTDRHPYGFTPKHGLNQNFLFPPPDNDVRFRPNLHSIHSQEVPLTRSASKKRTMGHSSGSSGKPNPLEFAREIARNLHLAGHNESYNPEEPSLNGTDLRVRN